MQHNPVMLKESLEILNPKDNGLYIDCTFGWGSLSEKILQLANCSVIAFDRDSSVIDRALEIKQKFGNRFTFICDNFSNIATHLAEKRPDGVVFDLGVSSMQFDRKERGFSIMHDGPLDMRMDQSTGCTAADIINSYSENEIADILYYLGEETRSRVIARKIVSHRKKNPFTRTSELKTIIEEILGKKRGKIHPATKTFMALRIFINKEIESIEKGLSLAIDLINKNGHIVIISFHGLECRVVKKTIKEKTMVLIDQEKEFFVTKKALTPSNEEKQANPRSRSAKMRYITRIK